MKRKHKKYSRPKRPFDKARIEEEAKIKSIRERAKKLITSEPEEQHKFFDKLNKIGLNVQTIADVLSLDKRDYLNRRFQTVVFKKRLVTTIKTARQVIINKKVFVDDKIINIPSYIVPIKQEAGIKLKASKKREAPIKEKEEVIKTEEEGKNE